MIRVVVRTGKRIRRLRVYEDAAISTGSHAGDLTISLHEEHDRKATTKTAETLVITFEGAAAKSLRSLLGIATKMDRGGEVAPLPPRDRDEDGSRGEVVTLHVPPRGAIELAAKLGCTVGEAVVLLEETIADPPKPGALSLEEREALEDVAHVRALRGRKTDHVLLRLRKRGLVRANAIQGWTLTPKGKALANVSPLGTQQRRYLELVVARGEARPRTSSEIDLAGSLVLRGLLSRHDSGRVTPTCRAVALVEAGV